jgi:hypothetical protein
MVLSVLENGMKPKDSVLYRFLRVYIDGHKCLKLTISSISIRYSNASVSVCSPKLTQSPSESTYLCCLIT